MSQCRSCGAEITWVYTEEGKRMPLDAAPCPDGNVVVIGGAGGTPVVRVLPLSAAVPHQFRYQSHFATCPHAGDWRRRS